MSEKLDKIMADLDSLTLKEAAELSKLLQEHWGVSAAAPMAVGMMAGAMTGAAAAAAPAEVEEQTEFDVLLKDFGAKKINVIKAVRAVTSLGLKEAKDLVESAPTTVLSAVAKDVAENARQQLEAEGASVEIK